MEEKCIFCGRDAEGHCVECEAPLCVDCAYRLGGEDDELYCGCMPDLPALEPAHE